MLKLLMDELFPAYGLARKEVEIEEDELSESDPDYWSSHLSDHTDIDTKLGVFLRHKRVTVSL